MRKNIEKIIGLTLCVGMLTGCAKTPESSLVKPKGSSAMDAYKEADDSVDMVENNTASDEAAADSNSAASENDSINDSNNSSSAASAAKTTIRDLINAPQTYKSQVTDDSAKLVVNTDATVEIPDVDKISAISVTPGRGYPGSSGPHHRRLLFQCHPVHCRQLLHPDQERDQRDSGWIKGGCGKRKPGPQ